MELKLNTIFKHPKIIILLIAIVTLFFSVQLVNISLDNDVHSFIPDDHPEVIKYYENEEQFGSDRIFAVAIESISGTIFTSSFIELISSITEDFETINYDIEVSSFANTSYIEGTLDGFVVKPMLEDYKGTADDILKLKERLLSWELYEGSLYSSDFCSAQIFVQLNSAPTEEERNYIYEYIRNTLTNIDDPSINWYITGLPAVTYLISNNMEADLINLIPLVLLVVIVTLYLSFRRIGGVILPLLTIIVSIIWTLGLMSLLGISLSMLDTIIPVLLVAVGSAYGIHIISHYYDELKLKNYSLSEAEHIVLVLSIIKRIGKPILLAGLTTAIGFGSLISSKVVPIKTFGTFTAVGVSIALFISITLIPSLLLLRNRGLKASKESGFGEDTTAFNLLYNFFHRHTVRVIILFIIISAVGIYGTNRIERDNVLVEYFKKGTEIRIADNFLNNKFSGTTFFEIIVSGENLSLVAREIKLGDHILLSEFEERAGGKDKASILEDTLEAVIGAVYLDSGIHKVDKVVSTLILDNIDKALDNTLTKNYKSELLELVQSKGLEPPTYEIVDEEGPEHEKIFTVKAIVDGKEIARGSSSSKKRAEQEASRIALENLSELK